MNAISKLTYKSPIGLLEIISIDDAIVGVDITDKKEQVNGGEISMKLAEKAVAELEEYFAGTRKSFDLPLKSEGTDFQQKVWQQLEKIPYGETRTYGEIAEPLDNPKAARAIGMANNRNPILILRPCHRVIGADGSLTGYAAGIKAKKFLLDLEKATDVK
ncbi:methylated-DNA--[protein]-cysteine S-methyltransferase [Lactobacillus kalixensis]|uniref:Methylated-DNA--protein-cysteine methyltransferase n=1 Tax=Lactobacillus kalixensis DSM 16043 TaxID=1423763 RepID=A0A0R1UDM9_9LACO|nr:methylated-DNA--[protein]-cysteine S-methyltransferase [Lactobacillus kalixensis]KRL89306.1 methylated-DNA--[protein]-cysteine S-methyltransferase [Lactobacillus kalixensis DSM 16043]